MIQWLSDFTTIDSEARNKKIHERGIKILSQKQILQKLPIAVAQVQANNTSDILRSF